MDTRKVPILRKKACHGGGRITDDPLGCLGDRVAHCFKKDLFAGTVPGNYILALGAGGVGQVVHEIICALRCYVDKDKRRGEYHVQKEKERELKTRLEAIVSELG